VTKKKQPFNNPFSGLKLPEPKPATSEPKAVRRPAPRPSDETSERMLFLETVGEVVPVEQRAQRVSQRVPPNIENISIPNEEAESLARLAELVSGEGPFDLSDSDEFIEGAVAGFDGRVMRKLRRGAFSYRAHLDLHGLRREEAKTALERFLGEARVAGHRCVLVVTGRGLHSKDSIPVLKQSVQVWLTHGRPARQVLAFCSARPEDGGAGAVYVLLRR
jgi:DNA-nicking Smr family endonuclease